MVNIVLAAMLCIRTFNAFCFITQAMDEDERRSYRRIGWWGCWLNYDGWLAIIGHGGSIAIAVLLRLSRLRYGRERQ
jgi:hypothetical protein